MTVYNREMFIGDAIESVLQSTYSNLELIIVDDNSKDRSVDIAKRFAKKDERIRIYINGKNLGDYPNRNKAASYAKGKYLKYVDSDDILYPFGLSMMVNRIESAPTAAIALAKRGFKDKPFPVVLSPQESYYLNFIKGISLFDNAPTSAIINRNIFFELGGFTGLNQYGDYEFWLTVAGKYPIVLMEGDVTWDRDHTNSEKYRDDPYFKARLRYSISKKALKLVTNPLSVADTKAAIKFLDSNYSKYIMKSIMRGHFKKGLSLLKAL